jgi:hypothetical protein
MIARGCIHRSGKLRGRRLVDEEPLVEFLPTGLGHCGEVGLGGWGDEAEASHVEDPIGVLAIEDEALGRILGHDEILDRSELEVYRSPHLLRPRERGR